MKKELLYVFFTVFILCAKGEKQTKKGTQQMSAPALSNEAIAELVKKATKDKHVTVTLRRGDDTTTTMVAEGIVTENKGDSFRFHPEGAESADATALVPDGKADTQYLEIKIKGGETHNDIDLFSLKRSTLKSNMLGITEYDPRTWVRVIAGTSLTQLPIMVTMIMNTLDTFFGTSPRPAGTYGQLAANDEEKYIHRETIQSFLTLASVVAINEGIYDMLMHPLVRLCAIRRAQGTEGDKRKKILAKAQQIQQLRDPKNRDEEWVRYNNQPAGADPIN